MTDTPAWVQCRWPTEPESRPTEEGQYRVLRAGDSDSVDGVTAYAYPDHLDWATVYRDEGEIFASVAHGDADDIIAWCGPIAVPPCPYLPGDRGSPETTAA